MQNAEWNFDAGYRMVFRCVMGWELFSPDGPLGSSMLGTEIVAFAKCLLSLIGLLSQKSHLRAI